MKKTLVLAAAALILSSSAAFAEKMQNTNSRAYQQKAGAAATMKANEASMKKGEPALKMSKTTTTTDVYDVSTTDKKGTTDYGIVEETVTNAQGSTTSGGVVYSSYMPSKAAKANAYKGEWSLAVGQTYSFNKDIDKDRYGTNGMAAGANVLWDMSDHFGLGFDYMFLNPNGKSHNSEVSYHKIRAYNIALAGKYTLNAWDNWRVYVPLGAGMMNARMKTGAEELSTSKDKWGASFYGGLGLEYNITADWFAGLEYRYTYAFINDKHLSNFGRDRDLQYHTGFFRLGMRF